jgi:hypothetical protein
MASYIDFNTEKRKVAQSDFEKDLYKLLNNAVFGKTMENLRNRIDVRIVTNAAQAERFTALPELESFEIINQDATMVKLAKSKIRWNKPTIVGFVVLELSKLHMYRFHYEHMRPKYGDKAKLLFTDTDSLTYDIETEDLYRDMASDAWLYDTSNYPKDHALYSIANAKVIGKFKDETGGTAPLEFVGLRSKMYSILLPDGKEKKTAKGIPYSAQKHVRHEAYVQCLVEEKMTNSEFYSIRSHVHEMRTEKITKIALSPFDDKRFLLPGTTATRAYGHYKNDL